MTMRSLGLATPRRKQLGMSRKLGGVSLLELMIAVALGLTITVAVVQLFIGSSRSQEALGVQARLQESARHALGFLARSARGAGHLGCAGRPLRNALQGDWGDLPELNVTRPVEGFEAIVSGNDVDDWQPSLQAMPVRQGGTQAFKPRHRIDLRRLRPGSDVVVFRRADPGVPLAAPLLSNVDAVVATADSGAFRADDFALVSACGRGALFRVTSTSAAALGVTLARSSGSGRFANRAGHALLDTSSSFGTSAGPQGAAVALVITEIYFVARSAGTTASDERWSLWRKTSTAAPAELVAGVEDMQLLFGIDATPDDVDAVERYVAASAIGRNAVRTVHIAVTLANDGAQPRTFTKTVALRNRDLPA